MNILKSIKNRRSIRKWKEKDIPAEMLEKLKQAIIWAPSAGNLQARKFYFVFNEGIKARIAELAGQPFVKEAPMIAVVCADQEKSSWKYGQKGKNLYSLTDACMSAQNFMLEGHEMGLGSAPVGAFDEAEMKNLLNMPSGLFPFLIIPIGFPDEKPDAPTRVSYEIAVEEIH